MKKITRIICLFLSLLFLTGCTASQNEPKTESIKETIYDAYVYAFSLVRFQ
ncbi:hypothetical protein [Acetobacterium sp.]|uniref:hypothetical protein n=1 Tax=Acetobacterium sp. TaxID=1872094 RepID=UPI003593697B